MSVLERPEPANPDELARRLEGMSPAALRKQEERVASLLDHRSVIVRWAAAQAIGRGGLNAGKLRERLRREPNVIVLTEITESLAALGDQASLPQLRTLAEAHRSSLVRRYALLALADIGGKSVVPYLEERRRQERSRRLKATLDTILFVKGVDSSLPGLLAGLRSTDVGIRRLVVNLLHHYAPRRKRSLLLAALREALERETDPGARGDLERAVGELA